MVVTRGLVESKLFRTMVLSGTILALIAGPACSPSQPPTPEIPRAVLQQGENMEMAVADYFPQVVNSYFGQEDNKSISSEQILNSDKTTSSLPIVLQLQAEGTNINLTKQTPFSIPDVKNVEQVEKLEGVGAITTFRLTADSLLFKFKADGQEFFGVPNLPKTLKQREENDKIQLSFPNATVNWYLITADGIKSYTADSLKSKIPQNIQIMSFQQLWKPQSNQIFAFCKQLVESAWENVGPHRDWQNFIGDPLILEATSLSFPGYKIEQSAVLSPDSENVVVTLAKKIECTNCTDGSGVITQRERHEFDYNAQLKQQVAEYVKKMNDSLATRFGFPAGTAFFAGDLNAPVLNPQENNFAVVLKNQAVPLGSFIYQLKAEDAGWNLTVSRAENKDKPVLTFNLGDLQTLTAENNQLISESELNRRLSTISNQEFKNQLDTGVLVGVEAQEIGGFTIPEGAAGVTARQELNKRLKKLAADAISRIPASKNVSLYIKTTGVQGQEMVYRLNRITSSALSSSANQTGKENSSAFGILIFPTGFGYGAQEGQTQNSFGATLQQSMQEDVSMDAFLNSVTFGNIYLVQK